MMINNKLLITAILNALPEDEKNDLIRSLQNHSGIKLQAFKTEYLESLESMKSKSYLKSIDYAFVLLIRFTGDINIQNVDIRLVEKFIQTTFKRTQSLAANVYKTLRAAFNKAKDWGYIDQNPFVKMKLPKIQRSKPAFITAKQLETILIQKDKSKNDIIPEYLKDVYRVLFYTGLRGSEIVNLTWRNVNLKEKTIQIGDDNFITKTKETRIIPLNDIVFKILSKRVKKIMNIEGYVFEKIWGNAKFSKDKSDRRFTVDYLSRRWKAACVSAGIDNIHLHSIRHSTASNLVNLGIDLYTVQRILGHSDIKTTQIYSHLKIETLRDAVNRLSVVSSGVGLG